MGVGFPRVLVNCLCCALMALACCGASSGYAGSYPEQVRIAVIDDVPSTVAGMALLNEAYARLGVDMQVLVLPSRRALYLADRGKLDGDLFRITTVAEDYPNLQRVDYPLLQGGLYAVVLDPAATDLLRHTGRRLNATLRRGVLIAEQTAETLGMYPLPAESYEQMRRLLEYGRADLALVSDIEGLSPVSGPGWSHLNRLPEPVVRFTLYHYLNRRHAQLAAELAVVLEQLEREGFKAHILQEALSRQAGQAR